MAVISPVVNGHHTLAGEGFRLLPTRKSDFA